MQTFFFSFVSWMVNGCWNEWFYFYVILTEISIHLETQQTACQEVCKIPSLPPKGRENFSGNSNRMKGVIKLPVQESDQVYLPLTDLHFSKFFKDPRWKWIYSASLPVTTTRSLSSRSSHSRHESMKGLHSAFHLLPPWAVMWQHSGFRRQWEVLHM